MSSQTTSGSPRKYDKKVIAPHKDTHVLTCIKTFIPLWGSFTYEQKLVY